MDLDARELYRSYNTQLEDPWGRRDRLPRYRRSVELFGYPVELASNHPAVPDSLDLSARLFTRAPQVSQEPFTIQVAVRDLPQELPPPPENLFAHIVYTGAGEWLHLQLGGWGSCFVDLAAGRATAVVSSLLAERPDLLSRCLLNTVINNFFIYLGMGMLHASCLVKGERALLLMAPHNSGKSTTALRLILAGYQLQSDSMIYVSNIGSRALLNAFPVGRIKLRRDMLPEFPELAPYLDPEPVGGEIKYVVDLRRYNPRLVCDQALAPERVSLCLLSVGKGEETSLRPADSRVISRAIMENSLYYDAESAWLKNLDSIAQLLPITRVYHLAVGRNPQGILAAARLLEVG